MPSALRLCTLTLAGWLAAAPALAVHVPTHWGPTPPAASKAPSSQAPEGKPDSAQKPRKRPDQRPRLLPPGGRAFGAAPSLDEIFRTPPDDGTPSWARQALPRQSLADVLAREALADLPLAPTARRWLVLGRRAPYRRLRIDPSGRVQDLGRAWMTILVRRPDASARVVRRGDLAWLASEGEAWLPLVVNGRLVGSLVGAPTVAVNLDFDGDGLVDLRVRAAGGASLWTVLDSPRMWRLLEQWRAGRGLCAALAATSDARAAGGAESPGGVGQLVPGGLGELPRVELCRRRGGGGPGAPTVAERRSPLEVSERCQKLLSGGLCPLERDLRGPVAGLPPGSGDAVKKVMAWLLGEAASFASGAAAMAYEVGQWLLEASVEYDETHYVNFSDKELHEWEQLAERTAGRDFETYEEAAEAGFRAPDLFRSNACARGSTSSVCGGDSEFGERRELPEEKQRPRSYWEQRRGGLFTPTGEPGPEARLVGGGGKGAQALACRACRAEALYKRAIGEAISRAKAQCRDPRSQLNPAAAGARAAAGPEPGGGGGPAPEGGWWGGVGGPTEEAYCAATGERERAEGGGSLEDLIRGETGCTDPTARPQPEGGGAGPRGGRCRWRRGIQANVPTIGIAFGAVLGFGPCPEATCQPPPGP